MFKLYYQRMLIVEAHLLQLLQVDEFACVPEAVDEFGEFAFDVDAGGRLGDPNLEGPSCFLSVNVVECLLLIILNNIIELMSFDGELLFLLILIKKKFEGVECFW